MKALIVGASGQVGGQLGIQCRVQGLSCMGTAFHQPRFGLHLLDIRDRAATRDLIGDYRPDVVFLPAAMTHVDRAEKYPDECHDTNVGGAETVARAVRAHGGALVFFSTEHVFPATAQPCREADPVSPVSVYAKSKVLAENCIREILPERHIIIRTSWVFGPDEQAKNFVYRAVRTLQSRQTLVVPSDQYGQPTFGPDLAQTAVELARRQHSGTFHIVGPTLITRQAFAGLIANEFGLDPGRIVGMPTNALGQAAPRPLRVCLCDQKIIETVQRRPIRSPEQALRAMRATFGFDALPSSDVA